MAAGVAALDALWQELDGEAFLDRSPLDIHRALAEVLWRHPQRADIVGLRQFQQEVLHAALDDLAKRRHPQSWPLFHRPDGRRRQRIAADAAFFDHLRKSPVAAAVYLQKHNEFLVRYLTPADRLGRAFAHDALTDLGRAHQWREALAA